MKAYAKKKKQATAPTELKFPVQKYIVLSIKKLKSKLMCIRAMHG
jgi:hypothetical protein